MKKPWKRILPACVLVLWALFAVSRFGVFTAYVPFSGRIFSIDSSDIDALFVQNGTTGQQYFFETAEEKAEIAEYLNDLRYCVWIPKLPIAKGGWSYRIAMEADGRQYSWTFGEHHMTVNGILYIFPGKRLQVLREYVDKNKSERKLFL